MAQEIKTTRAMNPQKFALWLFIVTVVMFFAAFTSAYIVKQSSGQWDYFQMPNIFYFSTGIVLLSSVSMHWAYLSAKRDQFSQVRIGLVITTVLGILFLYTQYLGWVELVENNIFFVGGNASGSFVYVFTAVHGLHIISGLAFLGLTLYSALQLQVHARKLLRIDMCTTYWHFLDFLWVYLFVFLLIFGQP